MVNDQEPEDDDYRQALADVRARRDERIAELRGDGLSAREIARRLNISHPTVLAVLTGETPDDSPATTAAQQSAAADAWIRGQAGRGTGTEETDLNEWVRNRSSAYNRRRANNAALYDRLRGEAGLPPEENQ